MTINIPNGFSNGHLRFSLTGDQEEMSTAIGFSSAPGMTPLEEAEAFYDSFFQTSLGGEPAICSDYTWLGVRVERQTPTGMIVTELNDPHTGTEPGDCLPSNCAFLVDKVTGAGGRQFRGRMYFPPIYAGESIIDHNGYILPATVAVLQTSIDDWYTELVSHGIPPVLFHSNVALTPTLITGLRFQPQIATQRERMR